MPKPFRLHVARERIARRKAEAAGERQQGDEPV